MASFSITEKLAVTGAFLALVALVVGTEDDPGLVVTGQEAVKELRPLAPAPTPVGDTVPTAQTAPLPAPLPVAPPPVATPAAPLANEQPPKTTEDDEGFSPELGRVPLDFSKGPPPG